VSTDAQSYASTLEAAGQGHLVRHAASLPVDARDAFLADAAALPWDRLAAALQDAGARRVPELRPPKVLTCGRQAAEPELVRRLARLGRGLLAGGRVATLLLAGGQGTRLGHEGPKGTVVFGPEADRTLYRIHAERVAAASELAQRAIPFYVLVSAATAEATRAAFEDGEAWGLQPGQVRFLVQGTLPCLDDEGRALLAAPGRLARAPDGHGGALQTLVDAGVLGELVAQGVDVLTTYQVDNPLARPLDPVMLGWMVERKLQAIGKAVRKATPDEKVGVFARDLRGKTRIVEYTELPDRSDPAAYETMEAPLVMGSIALHGFGVRWLQRLIEEGDRLPLHRARKRVLAVDADNPTQAATPREAWKLERFIFDLFPKAARAEVQEVQREWEFAPVKNAEGRDSLITARVLVEAEVRRWYQLSDREAPEVPSLRPREWDGPRSPGGPAA